MTMFIKKLTASYIFALCFTGLLTAAEAPPQFALWAHILLPGQNGMGGEYIEGLGIAQWPKRQEQKKSVRIETLEDVRRIDLGQRHCVDDFSQKLDAQSEQLKEHNKLHHAVSQGTATTVNWLGQKTHAEQEQIAKALVLQSVLGHGNSAIMHTAERSLGTGVRVATYLPFARFWLPRAARLVMFPSYDPKGIQAIDFAKNISPAIPKVIIHNVRDPQLSINDARRMYCEWAKRGDQNVYLIETSGHDVHLNPLNGDPNLAKHQKGLQAAYKRENLPSAFEGVVSAEDVRDYQPPVEEVERRIHASTWKSRYLRNAIDVTTVGLVAACGAWKVYTWKNDGK